MPTSPTMAERREDVWTRLRRWHARLGGFRLRDVWWLAQITGMAAVVAVARHRLSLPRLVRLFDAAPRGRGGDWRRLNLLTRGVLRRLHRRDFCLPHALILFRFCRRWGYDTRLFIGARKGQDGLDGHAWVRIDGQGVPGLTPPDEHFATFFTYPEATP